MRSCALVSALCCLPSLAVADAAAPASPAVLHLRPVDRRAHLRRFTAPHRGPEWTASPLSSSVEIDAQAISMLAIAAAAAFLPWSPYAVLSASPERFLHRRGSYVDTRPIKGTIARGATIVDVATPSLVDVSAATAFWTPASSLKRQVVKPNGCSILK